MLGVFVSSKTGLAKTPTCWPNSYKSSEPNLAVSLFPCFPNN